VVVFQPGIRGADTSEMNQLRSFTKTNPIFTIYAVSKPFNIFAIHKKIWIETPGFSVDRMVKKNKGTIESTNFIYFPGNRIEF
jgi:hypothetical protein